ncbi:hypothetical protein QUA13_08740 [Microcoleus sp. S28C3]|uniref:hypothetical protein n=1 Tax=Microcoleus sp. S28C3 TaxID=3055414 RepID=UPI002FCEACF1
MSSKAVDSIFASHSLYSPCIIEYNTFATSIRFSQPGSQQLGLWGYFWFPDKFRLETAFLRAVRGERLSDRTSSKDESSIELDRD